MKMKRFDWSGTACHATENNVVYLCAMLGVSTMIVFHQDEKVATIAMGDTLPEEDLWQHSPLIRLTRGALKRNVGPTMVEKPDGMFAVPAVGDALCTSPMASRHLSYLIG